MTAAEATAVWGRELFEELLPVQPEPGVPVLLACDDQTVRVAGERLGYDTAEAVHQFAEDVKTAFGISVGAGFKHVIRGDFLKQTRPRPLPPFFPVLCLWVLAASRMGAGDARYPTSEYYGRLRGLLSFPGDDYIESFEFIHPLFERFADWLVDDIAGARGRLILPDEPHPRPGREMSLPWSLVADARGRPLVLGDPRAAGGALRIPRLGETIIFERSEDGLLRVEQPAAGRIWLLTRDPVLQGQLRRYRFNDGGTVPDGWALYFDAPSVELPNVEHAVGPRVQPLRIEGGLSLGRPRYLSGYPPVLAAGDLDTEERLSIAINGASYGIIGSGERIELPAEPGRYEVVVGDGEFRTSYDAEERGQPTDLVLRHELGKEGASRSGARRASENGAGATVCGATVSVPYPGLLPLLTRVAGDLETIDGMGELMLHRHVAPPRWLAEVGLEHGRWEILCEDPVWLLHQNARAGRPWARLLADRELTALSASAARRVRDLASTVIMHGRGLEKATVEQRWQQLLLLALRLVGVDGYQDEGG